MRLRYSRAPVTTALLVIIALVFLLEWVRGALWNDDLIAQMGAIMPIQYIVARGEYWRLLSGMFLHGGFLHWIANSWALYQLGMLYEVMFGSVRFAVIYFVTGLIASLASAMFLPPGGSSVGASGAILGILGAFIFSIRRSPQWRHEPWTKNLMSQLIFWAILNIILGFSVKYIDNAAHLAGLVSGLLLGLLPHRVPPPPPTHHVIDVQPYDAGSPPPQNQP